MFKLYKKHSKGEKMKNPTKKGCYNHKLTREVFIYGVNKACEINKGVTLWII